MEILGSNSQYIRVPFKQFAEAQERAGVKAVDLVLQAPHCYVDSYEYQLYDMADTLAEKAIAVESVTPLPYRYSIAADFGSIQHEKTIGYFKSCILAAKELGSKYLTITASGACYDADKEQLTLNCKNALKELVKYAEAQEITLLLGSVMGEESPCNASTPVLISLAEIAEVIEEINSNYLCAYVDTEVISICGETLTQWFTRLGDKIKLIRLTDGNYNGYRIWTKGCLPGGKILREIAAHDFRGIISLQIPGEKYVEDPESADILNRSTVIKMLKEEGLWQR